MGFEVRSAADSKVVYRNEQSEKDFDSKKLQEFTIKPELPFIADATMTQWIFDGIRMSHGKFHYRECVEMEWQGNLDIVHLHFNLKGRTTLRSNFSGGDLIFGSQQHNMIYGDGTSGVMRNENLYSNIFMIQFTRDAFLRLTEDANDVLKRFSEKVLAGKSVALSGQNLVIDLPMQQAIQAVVNCRYKDDLKKMFLLSKAIEILVMQAEAFNETQATRNVHAKTDRDKERIMYARDYLVKHLDTPPSISELAKITGINEFKLKQGFKEMFKTTVFGYLSDTRLELAKTDLREKKKSMSEIAQQLGYSSVQHFSMAFKKKYGITPRQLK